MLEKFNTSVATLLLLAVFCLCPCFLHASNENETTGFDDEYDYFKESRKITDISLLEKMEMSIELELSDGTELLGKIKDFDSSKVEFASLSGLEITVPRDQIKSINTMRGEIVDGEYRRFDPNWTRLFFAPTGRPIKAGEGYFAVYEIFFPFLAVGITDWMSLSGGVSLLPGVDNQLYYGNLKITPISNESFSLSFGGLTAGVEDNNFGIIYSCASLGDNYNAFTAGIGFGYNENGLSDEPALMVGCELRLSNSFKFISENWIVDGTGLIMFGLRFFGDNLAADFGLMTSTEAEGGWPFVPWLGFSYNFGK